MALAQTAPVLGDVEANLVEGRRAVQEANAHEAHVVVLPELALSGYDLGSCGPADLAADDPRLRALAGSQTDVLVGFHERTASRHYNSAAYLRRGQLVALQRKLYLPNYLTWEERKHSRPGHLPAGF